MNLIVIYLPSLKYKTNRRKQTNNKMTIQELRKEAGLVLYENPQLRLTEVTDLPHPELQQFIMITGHFFENDINSYVQIDFCSKNGIYVNESMTDEGVLELARVFIS